MTTITNMDRTIANISLVSDKDVLYNYEKYWFGTELVDDLLVSNVTCPTNLGSEMSLVTKILSFSHNNISGAPIPLQYAFFGPTKEGFMKVV